MSFNVKNCEGSEGWSTFLQTSISFLDKYLSEKKTKQTALNDVTF